MIMRGRFMLDADATLIDVDSKFADIMRVTRGELMGTKALDLVAPADRDACFPLFHALMTDRGTATTVKRVIRADHSFLWVRITLTYSQDAGGHPSIAGTAEPMASTETSVEPGHLLRVAEFLEQALYTRSSVIDRRLVMDTAWALLLAIYIDEARGKAFDAARTFAALDLSSATAARWVRALLAESMLVCDEEHDHEVTPTDCAFHLTPSAHARIERYLADLYLTLMPGERIGLPA